jgi:hypothetical protein
LCGIKDYSVERAKVSNSPKDYYGTWAALCLDCLYHYYQSMDYEEDY